MSAHRCRFCNTSLETTFADLGMSPLCESFLTAEQLDRMEPFYPLHAKVCGKCFLVQLPQYVSVGEIFTEYAYFSSYSSAWLKHAEQYVAMAIERFSLGPDSFVVELASNDGYLLQYFVRGKVPCLGIEPAANVAEAARAKGVDTLVRFFDVAMAEEMAREGKKADLIIGNNVLAQVPDINGFVGGLPIALKPQGTVTMEFPHLTRLIEGNQFDQIYHEHFCYFGVLSAEKIFAGHDMTIFDVEEIPTHGGSLRIHACHTGDETHPVTARVHELRQREVDAGFADMAMYEHFEERVRETKRKLLGLLIDAKRAAGRPKDLATLPMLEEFLRVQEAVQGENEAND